MLTTINVMLDDYAFAPERAHLADAGLDIKSPFAFLVPSHGVNGDGYAIIHTGVHVEIPKGYTIFLKSKSGLNVNYDITGEGVIDSGYTGEIVAKLYNHCETPYEIHRGDKIIQMVILPVELPVIKIVDKFDETERGNNGFGSTGK